MKTRAILSLVLIASCASVGAGNDPKWEPIRPSVFLVLRNSDSPSALENFDRVVDVIRAAAICLFPGDEPVIPSFVENIVVVEEDEECLVAFFEKGNGRIAAKVDGVPMLGSASGVILSVVKVSSATLEAQKSDRSVVVPLPASVSVGLDVRYDNPTAAEEWERKMRRQLGAVTAEQDAKVREGVRPEWR
jgi:hypothetical protein